MVFANTAKNNDFCRDCGKKIEIEDDKIKNGVLLKYDDAGNIIEIFKCGECYKRNPALTNFRKCEVYSRIVGYLRPVQQWNIGKKQEYQERKEFIV